MRKVAVAGESRYSTLLAGVMAAAFFSNLPLFLYAEGYVGFPPLFWVGAIAIAAAPLLPMKLPRASLPFVIWCISYVSLTVLYYQFTFPSEIVYQELSARTLAAAFLLLATLLFTGARAEQIAGRLLAALAVLATALNALELFTAPLSALNVGRPAGLYINCNESGIAISLGCIVGAPHVSPRWRIPLFVISFIGVGLTLSRGSFLAFLAGTTVYFALGSRGDRQGRSLLTMAVAAGLLVGALAITGAGSALLDAAHLTKTFENRLDSFNGTGLDTSADERLDVARQAWAMFLAHPVFGNGLASTISWFATLSTHNMYLYFMADHGIIGAAIVPLLLLAVVWGCVGTRWRQMPMAFATTMFVHAFFSHNLLTGLDTLTVTGFVAAWCWRRHRFGASVASPPIAVSAGTIAREAVPPRAVSRIR